MFKYIQRILDEVANMFKTRQMTPATKHMFEKHGGAQLICRGDEKIFITTICNFCTSPSEHDQKSNFLYPS